MTDLAFLVSRSVKVIDYESLAKNWEDAYGVVKSYCSDDDLYEVELRKQRIYATRAQLVPFGPETFLSQYPDAKVIKGSHEMTEIPAGVVVDFTNADQISQIVPFPTMAIRNSCRIVGAPNTLSDLNVDVMVNTSGSCDLVEFENIYFQGKVTVSSLEGTVVFRSCIFLQHRVGLFVGVPYSKTQPHITLDNCSFSNHTECAVSLNNGLVSAANCNFRGCGIGICVKTMGVLTLHDTRFSGCVGGVIVPNGGKAKLINCVLQKWADFGALVANGGTLQLENCQLEESTGDGVVVEGIAIIFGRVGSVCCMKDCMIKQCRVGVRAGNGNVMAELFSTRMEECKVNVFTQIDAIGGVSLYDTPLHPERVGFVNLGGLKCLVVVDNAIEPRRTEDSLRTSGQFLSSLGIKHGYPLSAMSKRILKNANLLDIQCVQCKSVAPQRVMYKKCSHCKEARYCSKQCQKQHWYAHYPECRALRLRSNTLCMEGYVACTKCGRVENQTGEKFHSACSRCLGVFYCGRDCQKEDWAQHKRKCKAQV